MPVLSYQVLLPEGCNSHEALVKLDQLAEEDPQLNIVWNGRLQEIHIQLMGEVQLEVLKRLISERFGLNVEFGAGNIVYRETIAKPVEGIGHFEPLRHYAEVHLLLEPGERGSGLQFDAACSEDMLDRNWQRLILTHLKERIHLGVLTGSPYHGHENHAGGRKGPRQAYGGRRFPTGDLSRGEAGPDVRRKHSAGALV
jgi:translation elongation factor EF-G